MIYMADIREVLSKMTIEQKIGQLMQYNANLLIDTAADVTGPMAELGLSKEAVNNVGSVLNFTSAEEVRKIQDIHMANDPNKVPMIFMMDVIHGFRTIFPIPLGMGCSFDPELLKKCTRMAAKEAIAGGVHVTFTPMVDYVRDARWGRVMETCGEDPMLNGIMGAAQVEAFQGNDLKDQSNMATCIKHFAAYGGAEAGRDYNTVEISEHALREFYLPAYKACVDAGSTMIMPSFNTLNGVPSIVNPWLMKKILKEEWGFEGVVISDYNAIGELENHGITNDPKEAARMAFDCGCDIEMCSTAYYQGLKELVEEGTVSMEELDAAVLRVLDLKNKLGLFEDPYRGASPEAEKAVFLTEEHRTIARKAAEESAVLLKNNGVLPFSKEVKKIALIGPMAEEHGIIGFWSCNGRNEESVTIAEGIRALLPEAQLTVVKGCGNQWDDMDRSGFEEAVKAAAEAELAILCLGEPQNYSGEGNSRTDLTLPGVQAELAKTVAAVNPNTAAVTFSGRPLVFGELNGVLPAILHMWFPGTEGGSAAANLLFGESNPCGKLSMTFPKAVGQCPIYYNHANTGRPKTGEENVHYPYTSNYIGCGNLPQYSFGHGLSYSKFTYESLELSEYEMTADGTVTAVVTLRNDSDIPGKETVMLYMHDKFASNTRPVQQLIAFEKVELAPGERKEVKFTVTEPMLRFWNNEQKYVSEPGSFELFTGYADHLLFKQEFILK